MLMQNLKDNGIPHSFISATHKDFFDFMEERRILMAHIVKEYYETL